MQHSRILSKKIILDFLKCSSILDNYLVDKFLEFDNYVCEDVFSNSFIKNLSISERKQRNKFLEKSGMGISEINRLINEQSFVKSPLQDWNSPSEVLISLYRKKSMFDIIFVKYKWGCPEIVDVTHTPVSNMIDITSQRIVNILENNRKNKIDFLIDGPK